MPASIITMLTEDANHTGDTQGTVAKFAWPGGYPLYYLVADGETLCPSCVNKELKLVVDATIDGNDKQWEVVGREPNWEDASMYCVHCNQRIESAYAEDEVAK